VTPPPVERYELTWAGKRAALAEAHTASTAGLHRIAGDGPHVLVRGDNLDALKLLEPEYGGTIRLIYIDPPYNTGELFTYRDMFQGHDRWLSMMAPRLVLARRMLRDDGIILVSIDEHEHRNLVILMVEIFGEDCHLGDLIWKKKSGGASQAFAFAVDHEYIVAFGRNPGACMFDDVQANVSTRYPHRDEGGQYSLERLDKQNLGYFDSLDFPIEGPDGRVRTVHHKIPERKQARWRWNQERVDGHYDELVFRGAFVYTKNYRKAFARPRSLLVDRRFGRTRTGSRDLIDLFGTEVLDYPKPVRLMAHLVRTCSGPDDLVMDFFAGSGSTAHAVLMVNAQDGGSRRCISVQTAVACPPRSNARKLGFATIADVCAERIRRAGGDLTIYSVG
jgi:adenine-specific DNA-methyltransferase